MKADIDKLTDAELVDLNNRIVARLKIIPVCRGMPVQFAMESVSSLVWNTQS